MKLFVNARFLSQPISGVQRYGIECSRKIKNLYPNTIFLTHKNIHNTEVAKELEALEVGNRTGHLWEQTELPRYLKKIGAPPLFNPGNTAPLNYPNNYITIHDIAFRVHPEWNSRLFSMWYNYLVPRIARKAMHVFTVSKTAKQDIVSAFALPGTKVSVTYNGVPEHMLMRTKEQNLTKKPLILSVGSFNTRKNHHLLIRAFLDSKLRHSHRLAIVGDKSKVFSETGISETELQMGNIDLYRNLSESELCNKYKEAEIVVSVSAYEGFGIPILEGIYNGCKVVCSDIPVYRELYNDVASFCNPNIQDSIISALTQAAESRVPDTRQTQHLTSIYNYAESAETILNIITKARI